MLINADFDRRVVVHAAEIPWKPSPAPGVDRKMLDRVGGEVARATSIVRYAPEGSFPAHTHGGGEEFLVLEGTFQDEFGDYPVGSYVRNPPTSRHTPRSDSGCVIFVKLHQFELSDRTQVRMTPAQMAAAARTGESEAIVIPLYESAFERVRIEQWRPGAAVSFRVPDGLEALVLEGDFEEGGSTLSQHSWLRLPPGSLFQAIGGRRGTKVWLKTGHLRNIRAPGRSLEHLVRTVQK